MTRLWVSAGSLKAGERRVEGDDFTYLARVHRLAHGDSLTLFDGAGMQAEAEVVSVDGFVNLMVVRVGEPRHVATTPGARLTLLLALLKGEKMDLVVQKAVELGVARIVPVATRHAVVKLEGDKAGARAERWRKIAREAARQCGRDDVPEVDEPTPLLAALQLPGETRLVFATGGHRPLAAALPENATNVLALIGPEGGLAEDEVQAARAAGFLAVGLGPRILRAETAALAALAVLQFAVGDLGR